MREINPVRQADWPHFGAASVGALGGAWAERGVRLLVAVVFGVACLLAALLVSAQEAPKPADPAQVAKQLEQARAYVARMGTMIGGAFNELEEARKAQNGSRVNCVSDALGTMKGLLRLSEGILLSMQECASRNDAACADHEYVKISIAFNKCEELDGQLKGCGGPAVDGAIDGRPVIEKTSDSDSPDLNPTEGLNDLAPKLENPPSASPFYKYSGN